jgi:hypothetical protein
MNYDEVYDMDAIVEEEEEEDDEYNERNMNALIDSLFKETEHTIEEVDTDHDDILSSIPDKKIITSSSTEDTKVEEPIKTEDKVVKENVQRSRKRFQLRTIPLFMKL